MGLRLAAVAAAGALLAAGCSGGGGDGVQGNRIVAKDVNTVNAGQAADGGRLTYAVVGEIANWNLSSADGSSTEFAQIADQYQPSAFIPQPDATTVALNEDLLVSATQTGDSPQTIVYKIQPNAVWSDGTPITADDFIWLWQANNGRDCADCETAGLPGYDQISSITGSDGGKTVTVTFSSPFAEWKSLFSSPGLFPAHLAKQHGDMATAFNDYFAADAPDWSGGPWIISAHDDQSVTMKPNPKWYGKVKPHLDELVFKILGDTTNLATQLGSREVDVIAPKQATVDMIPALQGLADKGVVYQMDPGLTWEQITLNLANPALAQKPLRQALFTAVKTQDIIDATVGQVDKDIKPLGSLVYLPGQPGYADNAGALDYGKGDLDAAKKILSDAGYTGVGDKLVDPDGTAVPALRCRWWTTAPQRADECTIVGEAAKALGVTVNNDPTDNFGPDIAGKHDFDIVIFSWDGAPFPASGAAQLWTTDSGLNFGSYSNKDVDTWLSKAVSTTDPNAIPDLLNKADKQVLSDAYVLPLYQVPKVLAYYKDFVNVRNNPTNWGPAYNTQEWGKAAK